MAITNAELIRDALSLIEVIGVGRSVPAEISEHAISKLNKLMAEWKQHTIDLQYHKQTMADIGKNCPIPEYAELAVTYYLSFALAPHYGRTPSQEMIDLADGYMSGMRRDAQAANMREARMDHLQRGEGERGAEFDIALGE